MIALFVTGVCNKHCKRFGQILAEGVSLVMVDSVGCGVRKITTNKGVFSVAVCGYCGMHADLWIHEDKDLADYLDSIKLFKV